MRRHDMKTYFTGESGIGRSRLRRRRRSYTGILRIILRGGRALLAFTYFFYTVRACNLPCLSLVLGAVRAVSVDPIAQC